MARAELAEASALSTVSVTGAVSGGKAVFTFTRTGGHLDEALAVEFGRRHIRNEGMTSEFIVRTGTGRVFSGFSPGEPTFTYTHDENFGWRGQVRVSISPGWASDMSGSYLIDYDNATVAWVSSGCQ